jgi:hypothetical protein
VCSSNPVATLAVRPLVIQTFTFEGLAELPAEMPAAS